MKGFKVILDPDNDNLDVSDYVKEVKRNIEKSDTLGRFKRGECIIVFENSSFKFFPERPDAFSQFRIGQKVKVYTREIKPPDQNVSFGDGNVNYPIQTFPIGYDIYGGVYQSFGFEEKIVLKKVVAYLAWTGSTAPTDKIRCTIYPGIYENGVLQPDLEHPLASAEVEVNSASEKYPYPNSSGVPKEFAFNLELEAGHYFFDLVRTGSSGSPYYLTFYFFNDDVYEDENFSWYYNFEGEGQPPYLQGWEDLKFVIYYDEVEEIEIIFPFFTGWITEINADPELLEVEAKLEDWFWRKSRLNISSFSISQGQQGKVALANLLDGLNIPHCIDPDDHSELDAKTYTHASALTIAENIVQALAGHHFIDENGVYHFKSVYWLDNPASIYTFNLDRNTQDIISCKRVYSLDELANKIRVVYNADGDYVEKNDSTSQSLYGRLDLKVENTLIPYASAEGVASYYLARFSELQDFLELELSLKPDYLHFSLGDAVTVNSELLGINNRLYIIVGIDVDAQSPEDLCVRLKLEKWLDPVPPGTWSVGKLLFFPDADEFSFWCERNFFWPNEVGENFLCLYQSRIVSIRADLIIGSDSWTPQGAQCKVYATDSNGYPTGSAIATAEDAKILKKLYSPVMKYGFYRIQYSFPASMTALSQNTRYAFVINAGPQRRGFRRHQQDAYPNGYSLYKSSAWNKNAKDMSFKMILKQT